MEWPAFIPRVCHEPAVEGPGPPTKGALYSSLALDLAVTCSVAKPDETETGEVTNFLTLTEEKRSLLWRKMLLVLEGEEDATRLTAQSPGTTIHITGRMFRSRSPHPGSGGSVPAILRVRAEA